MDHSWSHHFSSCSFSDFSDFSGRSDEVPGDVSGSGIEMSAAGIPTLGGGVGLSESGLSEGLSQTMVELMLSDDNEVASVESSLSSRESAGEKHDCCVT